MSVKIESVVSMAGDGKLPNYYWVSINDKYYILIDGCADWVDDHIKELPECKSKTIAVFDTYAKAKQWIDDNLYLGCKFDDILVNCITIEDRLSGQVFESIREFDPIDCTVSEFTYDDYKFTKERMAKLGVEFK
jgi:hypothetical protein